MIEPYRFIVLPEFVVSLILVCSFTMIPTSITSKCTSLLVWPNIDCAALGWTIMLMAKCYYECAEVCNVLCPEYPSCLQATFASGTPHMSSHTVPHLPFRQTSTRPSFGRVPPISLIPPSGVQATQCYK